MPFKVQPPLYATWRAMLGRCYDITHEGYKWYGARGIKVCERWRTNYKQFEADLLPKPENYSLDRIDPDGDYSPENCKWVTWREQSRNKRVPPPSIMVNGEKKFLTDIAKELGMQTQTIAKRVLAGLSIEEITCPNKRRPDTKIHIAKAKFIENVRARTHCKRGHEYTSENTLITKTGARSCRKCRALLQRQYRKRDLGHY